MRFRRVKKSTPKRDGGMNTFPPRRVHLLLLLPFLLLPPFLSSVASFSHASQTLAAFLRAPPCSRLFFFSEKAASERHLPRVSAREWECR